MTENLRGLYEGDQPVTPVTVDPPSNPGFYRYSGGGQTMVFLLLPSRKWFVILDNGTFEECQWSYIEQALSVWDLIPLTQDSVDSVVYPDLELQGKDLEEAVFTALGAASVCWETIEGAGVFDSSRCKNIGEQLMKRIREAQPIYG